MDVKVPKRKLLTAVDRGTRVYIEGFQAQPAREPPEIGGASVFDSGRRYLGKLKGLDLTAWSVEVEAEPGCEEQVRALLQLLPASRGARSRRLPHGADRPARGHSAPCGAPGRATVKPDERGELEVAWREAITEACCGCLVPLQLVHTEIEVSTFSSAPHSLMEVQISRIAPHAVGGGSA